MSDLTHLSTPTLHAMKARLTNWIVYVAVVDVAVVAVFAYFLVTGPAKKLLPFTPLLMLPSIALVPFLLRASAVKRELARRT